MPILLFLGGMLRTHCLLFAQVFLIGFFQYRKYLFLPPGSTGFPIGIPHLFPQIGVIRQFPDFFCERFYVVTGICASFGTAVVIKLHAVSVGSQQRQSGSHRFQRMNAQRFPLRGEAEEICGLIQIWQIGSVAQKLNPICYMKPFGKFC